MAWGTGSYLWFSFDAIFDSSNKQKKIGRFALKNMSVKKSFNAKKQFSNISGKISDENDFEEQSGESGKYYPDLYAEDWLAGEDYYIGIGSCKLISLNVFIANYFPNTTYRFLRARRDCPFWSFKWKLVKSVKFLRIRMYD